MLLYFQAFKDDWDEKPLEDFALCAPHVVERGYFGGKIGDIVGRAEDGQVLRRVKKSHSSKCYDCQGGEHA